MKITCTTSIFLIFSLLKLHAQPLYDPNQITVMEITFAQSNWDQLLDDFYAAGNGERLLANVEINGVAFDSVGIRYRGGSTYSPTNTKNPLNIKLDYVKNQDYEGYDVLKLGNGAKDPSWLREVLSLEIARNYMEAPQANYASVYVNGNFLGLYNNVESINARFFEDRFLSNADNARFECNPTYPFDDIPLNPPFGCNVGHGAALEYLGGGIICYFDHYEMQSPTGWEDLRDLTEVLQNNPPAARTKADLDRFIWMCALNGLLANLDSYLGAGSRNYFIGKADNGRFVPCPDDLNESFARFPWTTVPQAAGPQPPLSFYTNLDPFLGANDATKPLLKTIFGNATWKRMYTAHLRTMMAEMFGSGWFGQRTEALQNLIGDEVLSDANHFYTHDEFLQNLNSTVIDFYNGEDAYGLLPLMDGRIAFLQNLPEFQAVPPVISGIAASPGQPQPGTEVTFTASVSGGGTVLLGYRGTRKDMFDLVPMFDDGAHGDGAANDGVFGAKITVQVGGVQYYIYAENSAAGLFSPQRAEFEFYEISTYGDAVINELMAANKSTVADQDGEYDDWAEIYNTTSATIDLSGWYLSDNAQLLTKWQFPAGVFLNAGAYLTVWVDDDETQAGLHTSFNLSASGESLFLVKPSGTVADQVTFGAQADDISLARCPNGTGTFVAASPTFGAENTPGCTTGTEDFFEKPEVKIFPNPASETVSILADLPGERAAELVSPIGQTLRQAKFNARLEWDISGLPAGMYFIEIDGKKRGKLLIIR
ncbi:MAG: CotH kinase family protein [Bacteroidetes bacterium]|nr:CotH kinase family protein [Bacteroidota bacterium]